MRTSGGLVAASGLVVLVWAAIRVFGNVENAFNTIWEVQKPRSLTRRASTYAAVIFVMPLLAVMLALVLSYIRTLIANYASIPYSVLYAIGSFAVLWLLFAGAYKIIPNSKVRFRHAAMAALIAAVPSSAFNSYMSLAARPRYRPTTSSTAALPQSPCFCSGYRQAGKSSSSEPNSRSPTRTWRVSCRNRTPRVSATTTDAK